MPAGGWARPGGKGQSLGALQWPSRQGVLLCSLAASLGCGEGGRIRQAWEGQRVRRAWRRKRQRGRGRLFRRRGMCPTLPQGAPWRVVLTLAIQCPLWALAEGPIGRSAPMSPAECLRGADVRGRERLAWVLLEAFHRDVHQGVVVGSGWGAPGVQEGVWGLVQGGFVAVRGQQRLGGVAVREGRER